jgi:hypothetical protein
MIRRALDFLVRVKRGLTKKRFVGVEHPPGWVNPLANDEDGGLDVDEDDEEPLTWAEQKNIRKELRRFQLWHALRVKVPRGFEEGY